ncbi:MAG: JAB domain-containing protein [Bacteroidales bacterium]|nr:JAB domain-containing protein [Bacteroidales bacterium]
MKKSIQLSLFGVSEVQLGYKSKLPASQRSVIKSSRDAFDLLVQNWDSNTLEYVEEFKILLLNRANAVLGILPVSKGGVSGTVTDVRIILQACVLSNASSLIIAHNHPSGNLNPSDADIKITQKIKEASSLMDIQLLDHLILISDDTYHSFADQGQL